MGEIYCLVDPNTLEIRYVGKTIKSSKERLKIHLRSVKNGSNWYVHRWIRTLESEPTIIVLERDSEDLNESERFWIRTFREQNARLTNIADGGRGGITITGIPCPWKGKSAPLARNGKITGRPKGSKQSKEEIENRRLACIGKAGRKPGFKHLEETKLKMSISHLNNPPSREAKLAMSIASKKRWNRIRQEG